MQHRGKLLALQPEFTAARSHGCRHRTLPVAPVFVDIGARRSNAWLSGRRGRRTSLPPAQRVARSSTLPSVATRAVVVGFGPAGAYAQKSARTRVAAPTLLAQRLGQRLPQLHHSGPTFRAKFWPTWADFSKSGRSSSKSAQIWADIWIEGGPNVLNICRLRAKIRSERILVVRLGHLLVQHGPTCAGSGPNSADPELKFIEARLSRPSICRIRFNFGRSLADVSLYWLNSVQDCPNSPGVGRPLQHMPARHCRSTAVRRAAQDGRCAQPFGRKPPPATSASSAQASRSSEDPSTPPGALAACDGVGALGNPCASENRGARSKIRR